MSPVLRVALIGAGLAGRSHALDIVTDDQFELAGAHSWTGTSATALTDVFGGVVYPDLDAVLADSSVDCLVIAVPPHAAFGILERAAIAGKACLAEKPVAADTGQAHRLSALTSRSTFAVAPFNRRYQPHVRHAAALVASGRLGEVSAAQAEWSGPFLARFEPDSGTYRATVGHREGVLIDSGSHALDALRMLLGTDAELVLRTAALTLNERGADVGARFTFSSGATTVSVSLIDAPSGPDCGDWRIRLSGADGSGLHLDEHSCVFTDAGGQTREFTRAGRMTRPVADLRAVADGDVPQGASLSDVLTTSRLVSAVYDAALPATAEWRRPRAKALGRLNGAC